MCEHGLDFSGAFLLSLGAVGHFQPPSQYCQCLSFKMTYLHNLKDILEKPSNCYMKSGHKSLGKEKCRAKIWKGNPKDLFDKTDSLGKMKKSLHMTCISCIWLECLAYTVMNICLLTVIKRCE